MYDTPIGVGGKIDTSTGKILSGSMAGQTAPVSPNNTMITAGITPQPVGFSASQQELQNAQDANTAAAGMDLNPNSSDRASATAGFQSQIDALNLVYAQQKQAETLAGQGRLGQTSSIEAASGMLGSLSGKAMDDTQNTANTAAQNTVDANHASALGAVNSAISTAAETMAANRVKAYQGGAASALANIQGRPQFVSDTLTPVATDFIARGGNIAKLDPAYVQQWATLLKTDPSTVQASFQKAQTAADAVTTANNAATQKAALDAANLTKAQNDATTGLNKTISTSNGSFSSTDGGKTWTPIQGSTKPTVPTATPGSTTASGLPAVSTVGGKGILVAGIKVDPTISNDVQAVLEGRNTLYNIRQTMGRTNAAAAYMQKMRDTLAQIDPTFDFIASDAGGKFVSSSFYQRAVTAITSVVPNIDAAINLSDQVGRVGVVGVDRLLQNGAIQIGNQKVTNFHEAQKLIADEIGLALGQGTVSDMKLQLGFDVTDPALKPEVFASNLGIVKEFITNRLQALKDQRYSSSVSTGGSTPKGTQTDQQFVESSLNAQGKKYADVMSTIPAGQKGVLDNSTGQIGSIPPNEYDPSKYTAL